MMNNRHEWHDEDRTTRASCFFYRHGQNSTTETVMHPTPRFHLRSTRQSDRLAAIHHNQHHQGSRCRDDCWVALICRRTRYWHVPVNGDKTQNGWRLHFWQEQAYHMLPKEPQDHHHHHDQSHGTLFCLKYCSRNVIRYSPHNNSIFPCCVK